MIIEVIQSRLSNALDALGVREGQVLLELPNELQNGDYSSNAALQYSRRLNMSPRELATKLVELIGDIPGVQIQIAGPGFINFTVSAAVLFKELENAFKDSWGRNEEYLNRKVMVEFTDPNPFKEFHIGHLMSNSIGESISRLFEVSGADVKRVNYQGDIGLHVAKAIWADQNLPSSLTGPARWGIAYQTGNSLYETDPEAKKAIDETNKKLYAHDPSVVEVYREGLKETLAEFELIYKKLGMVERVHFGEFRYFDFYFFESTAANIGKQIVVANTPKVFTISDGAYVYKGEERDSSLHTRVFLTSSGLPTYEAKELGLLKSKIDKWGWDFDESITITASEQTDYFNVVMRAASEIDDLAAAAEKTRHITHGMMRFAEGKMSSRKGNVVTGLRFLQDLFDSAKERARESRADDKDELAANVALGAAKFQILRQVSGKDIIFDRERALSLEGDSGPYLQYAHARAHQVVQKGIAEGTEAKLDNNSVNHEVARLVRRFPEIVRYASKLTEPHIITTYLVQLASAYNSWYAQEQILDGTPAAAHKVAVVDAVRNTLKNGLWILGIPAPEKM